VTLARHTPTLLWFRRDLRLADNPALCAAAAAGPVVPVFILEDGGGGPLGGAARWWLNQSLDRLSASLTGLGLSLVLRRGSPPQVLTDLAAETGARVIHWNRRYEPEAAAVDQAAAEALQSAGVTVQTHGSALLAEPWDLATGQGGPYQVFTPYYKKFLDTVHPRSALPVPKGLAAPGVIPGSLPLADLGLLPSVDWAGGLREAWTPGEAGAQAELTRFLEGAVDRYDDDRDHPGVNGTSRLSPHLHWGEISPRQVWTGAAAAPFRRQLVWREFTHHLLHHFPHTPHAPLREKFAAFPWDGDPDLLPAWQEGRTGYPLVDAGMRQLWQTGWMHNRVRMVASSFLVKHLLLPWQDGARWFSDTLVDADLANNTFGWQWVAGSGADGAPYFRIFNPLTQSRRFDTAGAYIRRWVPELAGLPDKWIHAPWTAPTGILEKAGVKPGRTYPLPVVEHAAARQRALESYRRMTTEST